MLEPDREVVLRDRALPGLALLLEPERLLAELQRAWPGFELRTLRPTYLRYKPGTNCLAAYTVEVDGVTTPVHLTALPGGDADKLYKVLKRRRGGGLEPAVLPHNLAVRAFPDDRKLGALAHLAFSRGGFLRELLPDQPDLWHADLELLRYKPERRLVARLRTRAGGCALLKLYHAGAFARAAAGAAAFSGSHLSAALLGVHREHRALVWRWLEACPGEVVLQNTPGRAAAVGGVLAALHAHAQLPLKRLSRAAEVAPLRAAAAAVAQLLPELAGRAQRLGDALAGRLYAAPPVSAPVHGDFSADQVVFGPAGPVLVDSDAAALADPARDFGSFRAQLELDILQGGVAAECAREVNAALERGYAERRGALPPRTDLYTAGGLLRLAPQPFRTRRPDWPDETRALVARAEALLERT